MRRLLSPLLALGTALLPPGPGATAPQAHGAVVLHREPGLSAPVRRALAGLPPGVRVGLLARDLSTGEILEADHPDAALIPASTVKLVTAATALLDRGAAGWWSTELTVPAAEVGRARVSTLTLRGGADPTLSAAAGPNSLRALARQAYARGLREVGEIRLDERPLDAEGWGGLVLGVPMTPVRLAGWHGDPPASAEEARARVGAALIAELRRAGIRVGPEVVLPAPRPAPYLAPSRVDAQGRPLPPDPFVPPARRPEQGVASVRSAPPAAFLAATLRPSDNTRAEELLATLGARPGGDGTLNGALGRERALLRRLGVDLTGVRLADGSGMSRENRLTARALVGLLRAAHDLPFLAGRPRPESPAQTYRARRNVLAEALPQAGTGENRADHAGRGGTLAQRLVASGLDVRAKTGTLPGVSALAGYVTARSGHVLAFAVLINGPQDGNILEWRAAQDRTVVALAAAH